MAIGMLLNMRTALAWKTVPLAQAIAIALGNKQSSVDLNAALWGRSPSMSEQIAATFDQMHEERSRPWR
jgi:hypothetical protein